jgi:hypothetical protein
MKALIAFLIWCVLFVLAWPVAVAALLLLPLLWLLSIPFRVLAWAVEAILAFLKAALFLPARFLGYRGAA